MVKRPFLSGLLSLFIFSAFISNTFCQTEPVSPPGPVDLSYWIQKIQTRRGTWVGLKADLTIQFKTAEGKSASCEGTLAYQRLEERVLLECYKVNGSQIKRQMFILKTSDREFELYLPSHDTLYKGTIFSLEDSPSIESHLRAWDLYRAFKPAAIPSEHVKIKNRADGITLLKVMKIKGGKESHARDIAISKDGDLVAETYYGQSGTPSLKIERSKFETSSETPGAFPHKIRLASKKNGADENRFNKTTFEFKKVQFLTALSESDLQMNLPSQTPHVMVLEDRVEQT